MIVTITEFDTGRMMEVDDDDEDGEGEDRWMVMDGQFDRGI